MWYWTAFYGCLVLATLSLAWRAGAFVPNVWGAALCLATTYAASNACYYLLRPYPREFYSIMDAACCAAFILQWWRTKAPFLLAMVALFLGSGFIHEAGARLAETDSHYDYDLAINLVFIAKLAVVSTVAVVTIVSRSDGGNGRQHTALR